MHVEVTYKILRDLPEYPAGSIITHKFERLPSRFNDGTYDTDGVWTGDRGTRAAYFMENLITRCMNSYRNEGWVIEESRKETEGGD